MAGIAYRLNYLAPQARDAARDTRDQLDEVNARDLSVGDHVVYNVTNNAWKIVSTSPDSDYVMAVEMRPMDYGTEYRWLDISHGYALLSAEEVAAEVAEMEARADRDAQDRADRWGGGWDL
jgi:hypothetical protein